MTCPNCEVEMEFDDSPIYTGYIGRWVKSIIAYCEHCDTEFVSVGNDPLTALNK